VTRHACNNQVYGVGQSLDSAEEAMPMDNDVDWSGETNKKHANLEMFHDLSERADILEKFMSLMLAVVVYIAGIAFAKRSRTRRGRFTLIFTRPFGETA
jgi:hypothetical protein